MTNRRPSRLAGPVCVPTEASSRASPHGALTKTKNFRSGAFFFYLSRDPSVQGEAGRPPSHGGSPHLAAGAHTQRTVARSAQPWPRPCRHALATTGYLVCCITVVRRLYLGRVGVCLRVCLCVCSPRPGLRRQGQARAASRRRGEGVFPARVAGGLSLAIARPRLEFGRDLS